MAECLRSASARSPSNLRVERVGHLLDGPLVEPAGLELHDLRLLPHHGDPQRPDEPHGTAPHEALHVVSANQRNVVAEPVPVDVQEAGAMAGFLALHLVEHRRRRRIRITKAVGEIAIDAAVLFLEGNRERENLRLRQVAELLGHGRSSGVCCVRLIPGVRRRLAARAHYRHQSGRSPPRWRRGHRPRVRASRPQSTSRPARASARRRSRP